MEINSYDSVIKYGHNVDMDYRFIGFLDLFSAGYNKTTSLAHMYSRFRIPTNYKYSSSKFDKIDPTTMKFLKYGWLLYVAIDAIIRNKKYNSEKSSEYVNFYTADLIIFQAISCILAHKAFKFNYISQFAKFISFFIRRKWPMTLIVSVFSAANIMLYIKISDIFSDIIMDITFRRYVFDFKKDFQLLSEKDIINGEKLV